MWCSECLSFVCVCVYVCVSNPSSLISLSLPQSAVCVWTGLLTHFLPLLFFFCWLSPLIPSPTYTKQLGQSAQRFSLFSLFSPLPISPSLHSHSHTTKVSFSYTHSICVPVNELHPASKRPSLWPKNLLCIDHHMVCLFTGLPACLLACQAAIATHCYSLALLPPPPPPLLSGSSLLASPFFYLCSCLSIPIPLSIPLEGSGSFASLPPSIHHDGRIIIHDKSLELSFVPIHGYSRALFFFAVFFFFQCSVSVRKKNKRRVKERPWDVLSHWHEECKRTKVEKWCEKEKNTKKKTSCLPETTRNIAPLLLKGPRTTPHLSIFSYLLF